MTLAALFSLLLLAGTANSFYFGVGQKQLCLTFKHIGEDYHFSYQVNAVEPNNIYVIAQTVNGKMIYTFSEMNRQFDVPGTEPLQICFQATDSEFKSVSIDMWSDSSAAIKQLASKSDVYALHSKLMEASRKAHEIAQQEKFQEDRQRVHTEIIMMNEDTVKKYGVAKIIIVILLAGIQVFLFKNLFKTDNRLSI
jgi:hypothetical protein